MSLSRETYLMWKRGGGEQVKTEVPERKQKDGDRDPLQIKNVMQSLLSDFGWDKEIQINALIEEWPKIVGAEVAKRTEIASVGDGIIRVECSSTPWSVELRRIKLDIIEKINRDYPRAEIQDIRFTVPGLPTWKHGSRSVRGRGPRDTYG